MPLKLRYNTYLMIFIIFFIIVIALLYNKTIWINFISSDTISRFKNHLYSINGVLEYLDLTSIQVINERHRNWTLILDMVHGDDDIEILKVSGNQGGTKAIYANFALFRLRVDTEYRLTYILNRLLHGDIYEKTAIRYLFLEDIDASDDRQYLWLFLEYIKYGDEFSNETINMAIGKISMNYELIEIAIEYSQSDDIISRLHGAYMLGQLAELNEQYINNVIIISRLIELLHDDNAAIRGTACEAFGKHGNSSEAANALKFVFRNDINADVRLAALKALVQILNVNEYIEILEEAMNDSSIIVVDYAETLIQNTK